MRKFLHWLPRILGIVLILFLGLFALDSFAPGQSWWYSIAGFLIHLLPNYILLVALIVAWRNELHGGVVYLILGVVSIVLLRTYAFWTSFFVLSVPVLLLGVLFLWSYYLNRKEVEK